MDNAQVQLAAAQDEIAIARALVGVAASLSLCMALWVMATFILYQDSRRCGRRILFCLHASDTGAAVSWLLTLWLPMQHISDQPTSPLCVAQSYLLVFFSLSSYLWTCSFAFHLYQILGRKSKYPELYEHRYHLLSWGVPASTILQLWLQSLGGNDLLGESGRPWCWFRTWSDYEWSKSGFFVQLAVFYVPVTVMFIHNLATYIALLYQLNDIVSTKVEDRVWRRMMAYSWVFFLSFVWGVFALLYQAVSSDHQLSAIMLYFMSFFTPLQGAMNAAAYGYNDKLKKRTQATVARILK